MFVDLKNKPILVVGGGAVALRKLKKLAPYGGIPTVVAPEIHPEIIAMGIEVHQRGFCADDLTPRPALVIAATDDGVINREVALLCKTANIPVNVADSPEDCTFLFPALVQRGEFSAGISTGGASPTAAVWLKQQVEQLVPEGFDAILRWLEEQRPRIKASLPETERGSVFSGLFSACLALGRPMTDKELDVFLKEVTP